MQWNKQDDTGHGTSTEENSKDLKNAPAFVLKNYTSKI